MIRRVASIGAAAAAVILGGCGSDDEPANSGPVTEETSTTVADPEPTTEQPPEPVEPEITDEGHEGGGPDPGTEEAEAAEGQSGGVEAE